jgi:hypothetical protein
LTLTCGELAQGKQLEVSNATPSPQALSIAVIPVSPGLAVAGSCGGITASAPPQVKPGDTVLVTLSAASATPVSTSTPGLIVARAAAGEAAVLPLTITPVQTGIAAPLLSSYSVDEYRDGDRTVISIPVDLGTSHETSLPQTRAVAMLSSNDGHVAPVTYLGIGQAGKTTVARFSIPNVVAGTYKGTVDFTPDVAGGGVDVTLTVRDHWILAVLVLLLGILVAFGSQRLFGVTLPRRTLKAKVGAIAEDAPRRHGEEKAAAGGDWRGSTLIGVHDAVNALKADVDSKTQGSWISLDDKVVAALTAKTVALA